MLAGRVRLAFSTRRRTAVLFSGVAQAASYTLYIAAALGVGGVKLLWIATICEGGYRSSLAASLFAHEGFPDVANVVGGMTAFRPHIEVPR